MIEVETKRELKSQDTGALKARLSQLGFTESSSMNEVDVYYTRPDIDYMQTVECLRIRTRGDFAEMTYKPPTKPQAEDSIITAKPETNIQLIDPHQTDTARQFLENIGMIEIAVVDKHRRSFVNPVKPELTISIDEIENLGSFIEVEVISKNVEMAHELVLKTEEELQTSSFKPVTKPYRDLVMELAKK